MILENRVPRRMRPLSFPSERQWSKERGMTKFQKRKGLNNALYTLYLCNRARGEEEGLCKAV